LHKAIAGVIVKVTWTTNLNGDHMRAMPRVATLTATALIAAVSFTGATTALASAASGPRAQPADVGFIVTETGYGPTLAAAEFQARALIHGSYTGCGTMTLIGDGEGSDGTWWATEQNQCTGWT
jgi:hypothetical protein